MSFDLNEYPEHWNIRKHAESRLAAKREEVINRPRYQRMDNWIREQQLIDNGYEFNSDSRYPW